MLPGLVASIISLGGTNLMAQTPVAPTVSAPASMENLRARVAAVSAKLYDADARFSLSAMTIELRALITYAQQQPGAQTELRDALMMSGLLEKKRPDNAAALAAFKAGFAVTGATPRTTLRSTWDHFHLAELARDAAEWRLSATHYEAAAKYAAGLPEFTDDQRFGIRSDQAFVLHEGKFYDEALAANRALLADAERVFGPSYPDLRPVVMNIAQNLHALGRKAEAEPFLERALGLARAAKKVWEEQDTLFQLGVLTFELGRPQVSRRWMRERIAVIERSSRSDKDKLLRSARDDLNILDGKIGGKR